MHHEKGAHVQEEQYKERIEAPIKKPAKHNHHKMMEDELKRHFFIALFFTIPTIILSDSIQAWFGYSLPSSPAWSVFLAFFSSIVILYGGYVFYKGSVVSLKKKLLDMNVLVSIALLAGYLYSLATTLFPIGEAMYWEINTMAVFILFGHWMEMRASKTAAGAIRELANLIPPTANIIKTA
jgi:P-type Cu2+ transporter